MSSPLVSVVVPIYDKQASLPATLDSILGQDHRTLEVLCIDDASPDGCAEIVRSYQRRDPRVQLIALPENRGVAHARNLGVKRARGEYVHFFDADDLMGAGAISHAVGLAEEHRADYVQCMFRVRNAVTGREVVPNEVAKILDEIDHRLNVVGCISESVWAGTLIAPPFKLLRASFVADHALWFDESLRVTEDLDWAYRVAIAGRKIVTSPEVAYTYVHYAEQTLSKRKHEERLETNRHFFEVLASTYQPRYRELIHTIFLKRWAYFSWDVLKAERAGHPDQSGYPDIVEIFCDVALARLAESEQQVARLQR